MGTQPAQAIGRPALAMGNAEWAMLLVLSVLWGSSFFFFKVLGAALPPFTIVLGRVGIAAIVLNLFLLARGEAMTRRLPWPRFVALGALNSVLPFALFAWGERHVSSGMASILNATTPVFAVVLAHWLTRDERLTRARALGVALAVAGVAVLMGPAAWRGGDNLAIAGQLACLGASLAYAFGGLYSRSLRALPAFTVATGQVTGAALVALPLALAVDRPWTLPMPGLAVWGALAGLSLLGTVLAYLLFFRIVAAAGATNAMLVTFLQPINGLLLGHVLLGEKIPWPAYAGMALIGAGLVALDGRVRRWLA